MYNHGKKSVTCEEAEGIVGEVKHANGMTQEHSFLSISIFGCKVTVILRLPGWVIGRGKWD